MNKVIIWGGKSKNHCQEKDIEESLRRRGISVEIWNSRGFNVNLHKLDYDKSKNFVLIRNLFYSKIKDFENYRDSHLIRKLAELEQKATFLGNVESLIKVRDKLSMNDILRDLRIPHIKTYSLDNKPAELIKWIHETSDSFSNGVIIKDRFGGLGRGVVKVKRQGSFYLCDISCVEGVEQKYINETLNQDELKGIFKEYMSSYSLIGQPYINSSHEFNTVKESESVRVLDVGQSAYLAMRRIAESPINNVNLAKSKLVNGEVERTKSTPQEKEFCLALSEHLDLFLTGYDFIRTKIPYYREDHGSVYIPSHLRGEEDISLLLEINGLVQYAGLQELYKEKIDVTEYLASAIERRVRG